MGATISPSWMGTGTGVGQRENGFEAREDADIVEVVLLTLSVEDCRDLRRKGVEGRRKVGKTLGSAFGSVCLRKNDIFKGVDAATLNVRVDLYTDECAKVDVSRCLLVSARASGGLHVT